MGVIAVFLLFKGDKLGWYLSLIWAALQIPIIQISTPTFNISYFLQIGFEFHNTFFMKGDWLFLRVGVNFVGLVLFVLFLRLKEQLIEPVKNSQ
ncbi:MAG: hypothetical protein GXO65_05160 [Euryarchaeota archaeon]|nr:hypothetical protein [Euryarchaeota archaeon]